VDLKEIGEGMNGYRWLRIGSSVGNENSGNFLII